MSKALIGYTGFVGGNLLAQQRFDACYNSRNIGEIENTRYSTLVCAGLPAAKWIANRDPVEDKANIDRLSAYLATVKVDKFILISTVDVYPSPIDVDEASPIDVEACEPYGKHRYQFEQFIASRFDSLIVRLPGLFGAGLRKNVIYDFLHDNNLERINPKGVFQFYCLDHLSRDMGIALDNDLKVVNIAVEPTGVEEIAPLCLGHAFVNEIDAPAARYDYRSRHAGLFGGQGGYMYDRRQVFDDLRAFVAREKRRLADAADR